MSGIAIDILKSAEVLDAVAFHLLDLIESKKSSLSDLEAVLESGLDFDAVQNLVTLLEKSISLNDFQCFALVLKHQQASGGKIKIGDITSVNYKKAKTDRKVFDKVISLASQKVLQESIVSLLPDLMNEEKAWALMELEKSIKNKDWHWSQALGADEFSKRLIMAVKCVDICPSWADEMIKVLGKGAGANFCKPLSWYGYKTGKQMSESAMAEALLKDKYELAQNLVNAGYEMNREDQPNEIRMALEAGVGYRGIKFLLDSGFTPFEQVNYLGDPKKILSKKDIELELAMKHKDKHGHIINWDESLTIAIKAKKFDIIDLLVEHGLSIDRVLSVASPSDRPLIESVLLCKKNFGRVVQVENAVGQTL